MLLKWVPGTPRDLMVRSKRSPHRGYAVLRQLNPVEKRVIKFCCVIFEKHLNENPSNLYVFRKQMLSQI